MDFFDDILQQVPHEQERVLQRMADLGLVQSWGWNDSSQKCLVILTARGAYFRDRLETILGTDLGQTRLVALVALDMILRNQIVVGGYRKA